MKGAGRKQLGEGCRLGKGSPVLCQGGPMPSRDGPAFSTSFSIETGWGSSTASHSTWLIAGGSAAPRV